MWRPRRGGAAVALLAAAAAACGGDGPVEPQPPQIIIEGVEAGGRYPGPVTITIHVDRGAYEAQLNGALFVSGRTVSDPGAYELAVTARAGGLLAERRLSFELLLTGSSMLIVRMLNLGPNAAGGGGDAIVLTDSSAGALVHALVDAGPSGANAADPGFVARRLAALGVDTLAVVVLSHAHSDHFAGLRDVLIRFPVRRFVYNGQVRALGSYTEVIDSARARADTVEVPAVVLPLALGRDTARTQVAILPPLPDYLGTDTDSSALINEGSLGVRLERGSFEMLLTGDGEVRANARWRTQFAAYTGALDALKVGHHGANDAVFDNGFSGASAWLAHTAPAVALVSANGTSHPRRNATNLLLARPGLRTYCTNVHGTIEIRVNPEGRYRVDVERARDADCAPGTNADTQAATLGPPARGRSETPPQPVGGEAGSDHPEGDEGVPRARQ